MSFSEVPGIPSRRSRVAMRREATTDVRYQYCALASMMFRRTISPLHLKPSCNRKNSLNAASSLSTPKPLASAIPSPPFLGERAGALDRQICANKPSICRRPLRILVASTEEMLSNASERRDSMAGEIKLAWMGNPNEDGDLAHFERRGWVSRQCWGRGS